MWLQMQYTACEESPSFYTETDFRVDPLPGAFDNRPAGCTQGLIQRVVRSTTVRPVTCPSR